MELGSGPEAVCVCVCACVHACVSVCEGRIPSPPTPTASAHHTPPGPPSPPPRAQPRLQGLCPLGRPDRRSFPPHPPPAQRPRVRAAEGGWGGGGASSAPGPYCGPFKSRPLNPFSSADRNCRPSPLGGRDHAAPSPTAGRAPGPQSPVTGPGKGAPEAVRPEERRRRGKGSGERGRPAPDPSPPRPARANCRPTSRPPPPAHPATPGSGPRALLPSPRPSPAGDSQLLPVPACNRSLPPPPAPSPDGHRCPHPPGTALRSRPVAAAGWEGARDPAAATTTWRGAASPRGAARPGSAPGAPRLPAAPGPRSAPPPRRVPNAVWRGVACVGGACGRARARGRFGLCLRAISLKNMHKTEDDLQQLQQRWEQKPPPHGALTAAPEASRSLTAQRAVRSPWFRQTCLSSPQLTRTPAAHTPVPFKPFISPPR
ncbi:basic proline-rich protein-like [Mustela putorius furo]|uniref:Basic proline-rich protein-like n=1 Tax=Mustela putorius furo TaxID=9669 RepID=A0A8U0RJE4_MUSPF|nr:basic proline-rich protein-like [Mustela putorius furo]